MCFSVNKWNRFQDTSRLQNKLVWLSCGGGGGGGARGVYVAHGLDVFTFFHKTMVNDMELNLTYNNINNVGIQRMLAF